MTKWVTDFKNSKHERYAIFSFLSFYFIVALLFNLFLCSRITAAVTDDYFNSSTFKNIAIFIATENNKYESEYSDTNKHNAVKKGLFVPYYNSLDEIMIKIANNMEDIYFYRFLYDNKYIYFKEYSIPYERNNLPGILYCNVKGDFFKYNDDIKKYTINEQGRQKFILAERKLKKITYKNEYKEKSPSGADMPVVAFTFQYTISPKLSKFPSPGKTYEGKAKIGKNPEDGKWMLLNSQLGDNNFHEIFNLLPKKTFEDINKEKTNTVLNEKKKIRQEQLKNAKKYSLEIPSKKQTHGAAIYVGTVTSDDVIEIISKVQNIDSIHFMLTDLTHAQVFPSKEILGKSEKQGGGYYKDYKGVGNVFIDIQDFESGNIKQFKQDIQSNVHAYNSYIGIENKMDVSATVNIYCLDTSESATDYGLVYWKGPKSYFTCNERFKTLKEIK